MIYLDTNVLIYAFCKNVDNLEQKKLSQEILKVYQKCGCAQWSYKSYE